MVALCAESERAIASIGPVSSASTPPATASAPAPTAPSIRPLFEGP